MKGDTTSNLREKLVLLLSLHIKYGYSRETNLKAAKILGLKHSSINSLNYELRNLGYLVMDQMNTRINHLTPELQALSDYIRSNGSNPVFFLFKIESDGQ